MQYAKPVTLNVEECDRLSFLPYLFGNDFLYAEAYVYALAQKMMPEYPAYPAGFFPVASGGRSGCRLSQRATPAGEAVTVF